MRKIRLAGVAMVMASGTALATGSDAVTVSTTVAQSCSVNIPALTVALPATGASTAATPFSFTCNYAGSSAQLTYTSLSGGVTNNVDPTNPYNITPALGNTGTSAATFSSGGLTTTALTPVNTSFTLSLLSPILVAGTYTDTLTVSIAP